MVEMERHRRSPMRGGGSSNSAGCTPSESEPATLKSDSSTSVACSGPAWSCVSSAAGSAVAEMERHRHPPMRGGDGSSENPPSTDALESPPRSDMGCASQADVPVVTEVKGIPFWMPCKEARADADAPAGAPRTNAAKRTNTGGHSFSLWQALWAPAEISRHTMEHPESGPRGVRYPEPELMDLVLLPLALAPGRLGITTRLKIRQLLVKMLESVCTAYVKLCTLAASVRGDPEMAAEVAQEVRAWVLGGGGRVTEAAVCVCALSVTSWAVDCIERLASSS